MSSRLFAQDVKFFQRFATIAGVYKGPIDGKWSRAVDDAEDALLTKYDAIKTELGAFDARSEKNIATLLPQAQRKARELLKALAGRPLDYKILSGTRTYSEQDALFAKGRTAPPPVVTN